jgi:hypothetical protein
MSQIARKLLGILVRASQGNVEANQYLHTVYESLEYGIPAPTLEQAETIDYLQNNYTDDDDDDEYDNEYLDDTPPESIYIEQNIIGENGSYNFDTFIRLDNDITQDIERIHDFLVSCFTEQVSNAFQQSERSIVTFRIEGFEGLNIQEDVRVILSLEEFDKLIGKCDSEETARPEGLSCTICLDEKIDESSYCKIGCNHVFHLECIKLWLTTSNVRCPICRKDQRDFISVTD